MKGSSHANRQAGLPARLTGTGSWVVCQVLRWAFFFLDVTPIFLNIRQYCTSSQRGWGWDLRLAHLRLDLSKITVLRVRLRGSVGISWFDRPQTSSSGQSILSEQSPTNHLGPITGHCRQTASQFLQQWVSLDKQ